MPQPFLSYPLQSFPLAKIVVLFRGHPASLRLSTRVQKRVVCDLIAASFTDSHAFDAVAWIPNTTMSFLFRRPKPASWSPWITDGRITPFHQLHPLRSLPPFTSPFASTRVAPSWRPILSWFFSPL